MYKIMKRRRLMHQCMNKKLVLFDTEYNRSREFLFLHKPRLRVAG